MKLDLGIMNATKRVMGLLSEVRGIKVDISQVKLDRAERPIDYGDCGTYMKVKYGEERGEDAYQKLVDHPAAGNVHFSVAAKIAKEIKKILMDLGEYKFGMELRDVDYPALAQRWWEKEKAKREVRPLKKEGQVENEALLRLRAAVRAGRMMAEEFKKERKSRVDGLAFVDKMIVTLGKLGIAKQDIYPGGSIRREKPTVGDIDLVVNDPRVGKSFYQKFIDELKAAGHLVEPRAVGESHCSVLVDGFLVELKKTTPENLGAALLFVTGSGDFNMGMRAYAKAKGFALSQYGLKNRDSGELVAGKTEEDIFKALGVPYVAPKDRVEFSPPRGERPIAPQRKALPNVTTQELEQSVPVEVWDKVPAEVKAKLKGFELPGSDEKGNPIPPDFLWNPKARHGYYRNRGVYKIPDDLKLDRYLHPF